MTRSHRIIAPLAGAFALAAVAAAPAAAEEWTGTFEGASGHETGGTVTLVTDGNASTLTLGSDFTFDGAPDPKLAFGNADTYAEGTIFAPLKENTGRQTYEIPADLDPADYSHVWLWCEAAAVPLGKAALSAN